MEGKKIDELKFCIIDGRAVKNPVRAHADDAGIDIFAPLDMQDVELCVGDDILINTGIRVAVPQGTAFIIKNKSGIATKKKLIVGACVVDCGFTGELGIHLMNAGRKSVKICAGDKIAQGILVPIFTPSVKMISETDYMASYGDSERGENGFGSTGSR